MDSAKAVLFLLVILVYCGVLSLAATITVGTGSASSCTSHALASAVNNSNPGDLVTFNCGGSSTITVTENIYIQHNLTIDGGSSITIDGGGSIRPFICANVWGIFPLGAGITCTFQNLTITNGYGNSVGELSSPTSGGAIYVGRNGTLMLNRVTIQNSNAYDGGAVFAEINCIVNVQNSAFTGNQAQDNGGAIYASWRCLSDLQCTLPQQRGSGYKF